MLKKFAFFLPQFHEIPENDEWWGKGFTEWINVKSAKPMYRGHKQPKEPQGDNYYCLLDKSTVEWQTKLLEDYRVDGLIYYHYYFQGKKLLEKPAENLLRWKDINQKFFFCWANHTWYRSWNGSREVLIQQNYGDIEDWENHFLYLLKFFKDPRYEKRDNKPLFMIYQPDFKEKNDMFKYFDRRCKECGFSGICIIESYSGKKWPDDYNKFVKTKSDVSDFVFLREPTFSLSLQWKANKKSLARVYNKLKKVLALHGFSFLVEKYSGDALFKLKINEEKKCNDKGIIRGLFFEWDNTPRHKQRGYIITPVSKEKFLTYLNQIQDEEYVFINAWNEWAEGMILEPTKENGDKYLSWIRDWTKEHE